MLLSIRALRRARITGPAYSR